jgi:hypothetical protein
MAFNVLTQKEETAINYKAYYVATHGAGFYKTESLVGVKEIADNTQTFKTNLKLYPNPVTVNSYLEFELAEKSQAVITVYNLKGQIVSRQDVGSLPAGKRKVKLEADQLSAGTYIVSLQAGKLTDVTKFVKTE